MSFEESGIQRRCHATSLGGSLLRTALAASTTFALVACEPPPPPPRTPPAPKTQAEPASGPSPEAAPAPEAPTAPDEPAGGGPQDVQTPGPSSEGAPLVFEDPYAAGAFSWPKASRDRRALQADLARWNIGGLGPGKPWHPQPRVVISEPVVVRGKLDVNAVTRALRGGRYSAVRACYDPALQGEPELEGRTVLRLNVGRSGSVTRSGVGSGGVPDKRKFPRAMNNAAVRSCLARAFQGAEAARPKSNDASMLVAVDLWPGDVPLPTGSPGALTGKLDEGALREHVEAKRDALVACFRGAEERSPGVWGRLLMHVDVSAEGKATASAEHESTFPDRAAPRCVADVLKQVSWPLPKGGDARVMVPLRWGNPPEQRPTP